MLTGLTKKDEEVKKVIEEENHAVQTKLSNPSRTNKERLKRARADSQRKLRDIENDWWVQKAKEFQENADENNSQGFFNSLKEVYDPQAKISDPLLTADETGEITESTKIGERWKEHFNWLLNEEATTDQSIIDELPK